MKCRICGSRTREQFTCVVLDRHTVRYFLCDTCLFLQTEEPHWLKEAYRNPINASDTGMAARSIYYSKVTTALICAEFDRCGTFLDYGGGYGLFTRLMRDIGFDYYWTDPFTQNLFAQGFELGGDRDRIELVTAFEVFEHIADPLAEIRSIMRRTSNLFFSTVLLPLPPPLPANWHYYAPSHGQHISFYSSQTFRHIAGVLSLNYYSDGRGLHLLTGKAIPRARFRLIMRYGKYLYLFFKKSMRSRTVEDVLEA